jgi:haloalkane dehalogenase
MNPQEFHQARRQVDTPFGRISYFEQGTGPLALFVHGLPLCGYQWRDVIARLTPQRRCIAPDLMGLGYSDVPETQDVSFAAQARMLAALLDALNIDTVDLVGNDTGGGVSQILAASHPERVRSLTLANCEVADLWPNALLKGFYEGLAGGATIEAMRAMPGNASFGQAQLGALVYEDPAVFSAANIALYLEPILASRRRIEQFKRLADWNTHRAQLLAVSELAKASRVPSQVIWGDGDEVFDTGPSLQWLRANLGGLQQIVTIPRAKLFFPEEHPQRTASLLSQFWSTLTAPR